MRQSLIVSHNNNSGFRQSITGQWFHTNYLFIYLNPELNIKQLCTICIIKQRTVPNSGVMIPWVEPTLLIEYGCWYKAAAESLFTARELTDARTVWNFNRVFQEERAPYSFWIITAEAPPPPLQMPASPYWPDCRLCTMWPTILAPDILKGQREKV